MICPYCGASISENEEKCPYCDSYIDHNDRNIDDNGRPTHIIKISPKRDDFVYNEENYDQLRLPLVFLSMIPLLGIILGVMCIKGGAPKCGKIYLGVALVSLFLFPLMKILIFLYLFF